MKHQGSIETRYESLEIEWDNIVRRNKELVKEFNENKKRQIEIESEERALKWVLEISDEDWVEEE